MIFNKLFNLLFNYYFHGSNFNFYLFFFQMARAKRNTYVSNSKAKDRQQLVTKLACCDVDLAQRQ